MAPPARPTRHAVDRYAVVHDVAGPRIRLALLWSAVVLVAFLLGSTAIGVVFAATAAVGSLQSGAAWHHHGVAVNQPLMAAGAGLITLSATVNNTLCGLVLLVFTLVAVVFPERFGHAAVTTADLPRRREEGSAVNEAGLDVGDLVTRAANTIAPALFMGVAGAAVVQTERIDGMAFLFLFSAVSTYDAGDFLCGAGYPSRIVGPLAGSAGVLVVTAAMYLAQPPPFSPGHVLVTGLILAVACPAGQWLGSWLLPSARSRAPGLRRLDAWLLAAPVFLVILWVISD